MTKNKEPEFPSREAIAAFIRESPRRVGKREIARAFGLRGDQKTALKSVLKDLEAEGSIARSHKRQFAEPASLPRITVVEVTGLDTDGELLARPQAWAEETAPPVIYMAPEARSRSALAPGDRVLARLQPIGDGRYEGRVIRRLPAAPERALGVFRVIDGQGRIKSIDRRAKEDFIVGRGDDLGAEAGELVWAEVRRGRAMGPRSARVVERLGEARGPRSISLITIHDHDIPWRFPAEALRQADEAGPAPMGERHDLRELPLVTIDGEDARDFDDAVWAAPDTDEGNPGGWHLVVAIADVAYYVRPGDGLDKAAFERGNSVYFPDRVVPMLPEPLSNTWCSLVPDEDRPCLAALLWIDRDGHLRRHRFIRAMMRSAARLTYRQVQAARDGRADEVTAPLLDTVVGPLYGAYEALAKARQSRGVLELVIPERQVVLDDACTVRGIRVRERLDSHKLIEEFMITANVAAAETLEGRRRPCMYRVHDQPARDRIEALREFLASLGFKLARGDEIRARQLNRILEKAMATAYGRLVHEVVLRSLAQAQYDPRNVGHFGLALRRYCHFTSPIRRYADLLVHRALIDALGLGEGALGKEPGDFVRIGEHLSATERRAQGAERDAVDRFTASYLVDRVGAAFTGRIGGVTRFGLFVTLDETGADGLVPIRTLPADYYVHDEQRHRLVGRATGRTFRLADPVEVRLVEADPITGGLLLVLVETGIAAPRRRGAGRPTGRSPR